jgi:hypothetical protein
MASISLPVRVFALVGILAVCAFGAFTLLTSRSAEGEPAAAETTAAAPVEPVASPAKPPASAPARPARTPSASRPTRSGFPAPVDRAFRGNRVVVVVVYTPGAAVDAVVRAEARAGAEQARVGFVAISAASERLVRPLVAKTGVLPQPAVVVVRRPGVVTATLGVTDRATVAQTALQAKKR